MDSTMAHARGSLTQLAQMQIALAHHPLPPHCGTSASGYKFFCLLAIAGGCRRVPQGKAETRVDRLQKRKKELGGREREVTVEKNVVIGWREVLFLPPSPPAARPSPPRSRGTFPRPRLLFFSAGGRRTGGGAFSLVLFPPRLHRIPPSPAVPFVSVFLRGVS